MRRKDASRRRRAAMQRKPVQRRLNKEWGKAMYIVVVIFALVVAGLLVEYVKSQEKEISREEERKTEDNAVVQVVIPGDRRQAVGILSCAQSIFKATKSIDRIMVNAIVDPGLVSDMQSALKCALGTEANFRVRGFELSRYAPNLKIRLPYRESKMYLYSELNFARFYLGQLFEDGEKIVYLDADTIVLADIVTLWESALLATSHAIAAVSRPGKKLCGVFLSCDLPEIKNLLQENGILDVDKDLDPFNAGVLVIHLDRWRQKNYTKDIEYWIHKNTQLPIYDLFTNPPLMLAIRKNFEPLDPLWNCHQGSACWRAPNVSLLHWAGQHKPWHPSSEALLDTRWTPPQSNCTHQILIHAASAASFQKNVGLVSETNLVAKSPEMLQRVWKSQRRYAATLENTIVTNLEQGKLPDGSRLNASLLKAIDSEFWRERKSAVLQRMISSLESCPKPKDALTLVRALVSAKKGLCHYILIVILRGRMYIDFDQYSDANCGLVPPANLAYSLEMLQAILRTQSESMNLAFLFCTASKAHDCDFDQVYGAREGGDDYAHSVPVVFAYGTDTNTYEHFQALKRPIVVVPGPSNSAVQKLDRRSEHPLFSAESDEEEWQRRFRKLFRASKCANSSEWIRSRQPIATWRGTIKIPSDCNDSDGWSRVETMALCHDYSSICKTFATRISVPADVEICVARSRISTPTLVRRITKQLRKGLITSRATTGNLQKYLDFRYLIMLPDTAGLDSLSTAYWGTGAVILRWETSQHPEYNYWYEPALVDSITHITFTAAALPHIVRTLNEYPETAFALAMNARHFYYHFFSLFAIQHFWSKILSHYATYFGFDLLDHLALETELKDKLGVNLRSVSDLPSWFFPETSSSVVGLSTPEDESIDLATREDLAPALEDVV